MLFNESFFLSKTNRLNPNNPKETQETKPNVEIMSGKNDVFNRKFGTKKESKSKICVKIIVKCQM